MARFARIVVLDYPQQHVGRPVAFLAASPNSVRIRSCRKNKGTDTAFPDSSRIPNPQLEMSFRCHSLLFGLSEKGVIAMRASKVVYALFTTLFIPTFAAADKPPQQKGGEWQIVQLGEYGIGPNDVSTECVGDRSLLAKFYTIPNCSRRESHTDGAITTADAQCRVLDSAMSFHERIMRRGDDDIYIYLHVTYSPPAFRGTDIEQAELIRFQHLKRLGACPIGQRPLK